MNHSHLARALLLGVALAALAACHDDGDAALASREFAVTTLVSNRVSIPAAAIDDRLVNPWGLAFGPDAAWIANHGSNTVTLQDPGGVAAPRAIAVPGGSQGAARPTGLVFNTRPTAFQVTANLVTGPAQFIAAGAGGTLVAWSADPGFGDTAVTVHDGGGLGATYTGLALLDVGGSVFLFAADFRNGRIRTFDGAFNEVTPRGGFVDGDLPGGYAPFNVQAVNGQLVVTYARRDASTGAAVAGPGQGFASLFDGEGRLLRRFAAAEVLNAPWGVALAPADFGGFGNALLIGNVGDGRINAFELASGRHIDTARDSTGLPLVIDGLHALAFGNGLNGQATTSLFFTAGANNEADGRFGRIDSAAGFGSDTGGAGASSGESFSANVPPGFDTDASFNSDGTLTSGGAPTPVDTSGSGLGTTGTNFSTGGSFVGGGSFGSDGATTTGATAPGTTTGTTTAPTTAPTTSGALTGSGGVTSTGTGFNTGGGATGTVVP